MGVRELSRPDGSFARGGFWPALGFAAVAGFGIGFFPPLTALPIAAFGVIVAIRGIEALSVLAFWTLPYMIVNLPTGVFTLKLPEVCAYLFAAAFFANALLRKERPESPPATSQVIVYLGVLALSAVFAPRIADMFSGNIAAYDRNSPTLRPISVILWLGLSWMVVTAFYNVVGTRPALYWRCLRAHILSGGLASLISIVMYVLTLRGMQLTNIGGLGRVRNLVPLSGDVFRLAGVAYEPLMLAFYLVTVIPITVTALLYLPEWMPRWISGLSLTLQMTAMVLTFSAGGWPALVVALIPVLCLARYRPLTPQFLQRLAIVAVILAGLAAGIVVTQAKTIAKLSVIADKVSGGDEIRNKEWATGVALFEDYPILGVGPGLAGYHFPRYHADLPLAALIALPEVNNLYLSVLTDTGLIGMVAFGWLAIVGVCAIVGALRRRGIGNAPAFTALTGSLFGTTIQYMSLNALFLVFFCVLLGIATAGARLAAAGAESPPATSPPAPLPRGEGR